MDIFRTDFMIRFLLCNLVLSAAIGILLLIKRLLKNALTGRMQYRLWLLLPGLMLLPLLPPGTPAFLRTLSLRGLFSWAGGRPFSSSGVPLAALEDSFSPVPEGAAGWMNELGLSVSRQTPSLVAGLLCLLWIAGMLTALAGMVRSILRFRAVAGSSLPVQNPDVCRIYRNCLEEMKLTKPLPIRSTAFLNSPVLAGLFCPCIYLPIRLIRDCGERDMRFMLLHELSHHRRRDALTGGLMYLLCLPYWFNPAVWAALGEMKNDREVACDSSVLDMLEADARKEYGRTLIHLAEKISSGPFPFAAGLSGGIRQMKRRILNIAAYRPASPVRKLGSALSFLLTAALVSGFVPFLSLQAADPDRDSFSGKGKTISALSLDDAFGEYEGSFVLYDCAGDHWQICHQAAASRRISPASTFKPYSALSALENGVITPEQSLIDWDGRLHPFSVWNQDQTLESAMANSVNWYFQALDARNGPGAIQEFVEKTGYGNRMTGRDVSCYWADSSLKISPLEQVEMLIRFHTNEPGFAPEHVKAVENSICLYSGQEGAFYGKTGTGSADGRSVCGWFIGYVEKQDNTFYFAANIQGEEGADGARAAEITFEVLARMEIWENQIPTHFPNRPDPADSEKSPDSP